ncbi:hypothetical protein ACJX0J_024291 [Zea mays]
MLLLHATLEFPEFGNLITKIRIARTHDQIFFTTPRSGGEGGEGETGTKERTHPKIEVGQQSIKPYTAYIIFIIDESTIRIAVILHKDKTLLIVFSKYFFSSKDYSKMEYIFLQNIMLKRKENNCISM